MRKLLMQKRKEIHLSQDEIAQIINVSRPHYSKIENGTRNPSYMLVRKIKQAMNYPNDDLFDND